MRWTARDSPAKASRRASPNPIRRTCRSARYAGGCCTGTARARGVWTAGGEPMRWTARQIEALRLAEIAAARRLIGATAAPVNSPSNWIGWSILTPGADTRRYLQRAARGECTRCGGTPRHGLRTCTPCAERQRERARAMRARRRASRACIECGQAATDGARCAACRVSYRDGGRWAR